MANETKIEAATVKVMRSHDYCHFEVTLGSNEATTVAQVDELRKTAARLADKAVEQYKIAKQSLANRERDHYERILHINRMQAIEATPEGERTVRQQAELKQHKDEVWEATRPYNYEDDWDHDHED